jgi:pilus assembly protein CpaB
MSRRTALLLAALGLAAIATLLIFLWLQGVNDRAIEGQEPVEVLVVTQPVAAGTTGTAASNAGAFELQTLPRDAVAEGAISSIDPIANQVALSPLFVGEQVLVQKFGAPASSATAAIPEGKIAVSINLGDPQRVAAFLAPGSNVAIFLTAEQTTGAAAGEPATRVLIPTVQVIATGSTTTLTRTTTDSSGTQTEEQFPVALLTLAVDQAQAEKIIYAQTLGELYFGLLTDTSPAIRPGAGTSSANLFR